MTTAAQTLAEEASTNGAEPAIKAVTATAKIISASTELGFGFLGSAIAVTSGSYAAKRFAAAYRAVRS